MRRPVDGGTSGPGHDGTGRSGKRATAFRTIGEVAAELGVPPHVLRFWESQLKQVRPVKCRGGRRYYRPDDIALLQQIKTRLYDQGYTIKGVQRLLQEEAAAARTSRVKRLAVPDDVQGPVGQGPVGLGAVVADLPQTPESELTGALAEVARLRSVLRLAIDELTAVRALLDAEH